MPPRKTRKTAFDPAALRTLEELFDSTWIIVEARHPFRDLGKDEELRSELRRALILAAENLGVEDLDRLQQAALDTVSRPGEP